MEKLPNDLHAIMALFIRDDKVSDVTFSETMHVIDDVRQLHKLGLIEDPDKQWGRHIALTEEGEGYLRVFFPTKDEQIEDLKAALQDIFNEAPYLSHAYTTAYKALTGKEFKE